MKRWRICQAIEMKTVYARGLSEKRGHLAYSIWTRINQGSKTKVNCILRASNTKETKH